MRVEEIIQEIERTKWTERANWEFSLRFHEDHVTLSGQSWESAERAGYGKDCVCDYDADLERIPVEKALERLLLDGESCVHQVVVSHTHSYGRDEVGSYDKEYDHERSISLKFKLGTTVEWSVESF